MLPSGWTTLAGAGAVVENDGKVLLVRQRRPYGTFWELPSGYYEAQETFEEAAARETLEEAGVEIEVGALAGTVVWEREHDRRRNVLVFFRARPVDPAHTPRPQLEEDIDAAAYVDASGLATDEPLHPLNVPVLDALRSGATVPFHVHAAVHVEPDGTQSYVFDGHAP